ncbi:ADP-ribosylation_factor [Hexamita inflata]|uniref:ADP-ribosylation factor n=1 Tax=Hexamita inflata TaxID=28002 RepID=A0AA86V2A0_9EUKA|nr:ADP-ribosylation factor [Hexamita inflata]
MGQTCSTPALKILMIGTEMAGKTSILYRIKLDKEIQTIPTVGFNQEEIMIRGGKYFVTDLSVPNYFQQMLEENKGVIFVIDSSQEDMHESLELFTNMMHILDEKPHPILIFCSKCDVKQPDLEHIEKYFELKTIKQQYKIVKCSSVTGEGIAEGFQFLSEQIHM